jgi:hypothetical protein
VTDRDRALHRLTNAPWPCPDSDEFGSFSRAHADAKALVCDAADGRSQFGCLLRSPIA